MKGNNIEILKKLVNILGPSGMEQQVRAFIYKQIKEYADEIYIDKYGNLICNQKGKGEKIMIAAHMDEIGLMVKAIREDGRMKVATIGGLEPVTLIGQGVSLLNHDGDIICEGILTTEEIHEDFPPEKLPNIDDIYIDAGVDGKTLKKLGIRVGTFAVPKHAARFLGSKDYLCGKGLDDRIGCFILMELIKKTKKLKRNICYVFTVQEEIGLYGAQTSTYQLEPDWGIAVDVTNSLDSMEPKEYRLGGGPTITAMDAEMMPSLCLNDTLIAIAKKKRIPFQIKVEEEGTTDATRIRLAKGGIPATTVGVPVRNLHSTISICNMKDIHYCIQLLYEFLSSPPKTCFV